MTINNLTTTLKYESADQFKTSITDNGDYPEFCNLASQDDRLFNDFRRNPIYNYALEHDSEQQGWEYLSVAQKLTKFTDYIEEFKKNDAIGNPIMSTYEGIGDIAPTTTRYIKILSDLEQEFGTLDNLNICEIGVGYGGLCRIIDSYFKPQSYCLVDLADVLKLAEKYLQHFSINTALSFKAMDVLPTDAKYDLVISNYAFTELRTEIQDVYLEKVILKSTKGYITYNNVNRPNFRSYTKDELLEIIPNVRVSQEIELTNPQDCILAW
jgi:putative sugar O-methyltransferase